MSRFIIPVGFGSLDLETYRKSYFPLFEKMKQEGNVFPAFLNANASKICGVPLLDEVLKQADKQADIFVFPLILNQGKESESIKRALKEYSAKIGDCLLTSMQDKIISYFKRMTSEGNQDYVLLGHGSLYHDSKDYEDVVTQLGNHVHLYLHHANMEIKEKEITTIPFMLTNGRHIEAMNNELSLNHQIHPIEKGMLEDAIFQDAVLAKFRSFIQ